MEMVSNVVNNTMTPQELGPLHVPPKSTAASPQAAVQLGDRRNA